MSQENVKTALLRTMEAIKADPVAASVVFRADTQLENDVCCTARVREFSPITVDEPPDLGGQDAAPNPVELVLVALGTCQEIMYAAYASVMGIPLEEIKVEVKGFLDLRGLFGMDETVPPGYKRISFQVQLKSSAGKAAIQKLVKTVEDTCPVLDILTRAQEVVGTVSHNGERLTG